MADLQDPFDIYNHSAKSHSYVRRKSGKRIMEIDVVNADEYQHVDTLGSPFSVLPAKGLYVIVFLLFSLLLGRIFFLQMVQGGKYTSIAEGNRVHTVVTKALRGVVYDANDSLLVKNVPNFTLFVLARDVYSLADEDEKSTITLIQDISGLESGELDLLMESSLYSGQPVPVREHIPYSEALQLMIQTNNIVGLSIEIRYSREYLTEASFSHILGYTGKITEDEYASLRDSGYLLNDEIGKIGVEQSYESSLRGKDGFRKIEVDFRGEETAIISDIEPESGYNIHLSIDGRLQSTLYQKLKTVVDEKELPGASAVAIDPRNGQILALVSYPAYDNNLFTDGIVSDEYTTLLEDERRPLFHRALSGEYPSGSTFKMIVAAAGLEEGVITQNTVVQSTGGLKIGEYFFPDWRAGGHGATDVIKALADSVNTFFYLLGGGDNETSSGLGLERIVSYAQKFGLGKQTGIDLPGEQDGFLPSRAWKEEMKDEAWFLGDTYHLAIGQGDLLVTPLQVAQFTSIFANGGTEYQPQVVDYLTNQQGEVVQTNDPIMVQEQVVSQQSIQLVRQGMRAAVETGSARSLQILPVSSAGKTGTAQFGSGDATHSWFTSFAPYEDPTIALTVLVEEGGGGNDTALPIARETLMEYFSPPLTEEPSANEPSNDEQNITESFSE